MKPEVKKKWVEALRSGKYQQGGGALRLGDRYCCLGVLAEELGILEPWDLEDGSYACEGDRMGVPDTVLDSTTQSTLMHMNDGDDIDAPLDFKEIADWIEENIDESQS